MTQRSLFDIIAETLPVPFRAESAPQLAGAIAVKPHVPRQAGSILSELRHGDEMLAEEIETLTGLKRASICPRLYEMVNLGLVEKCEYMRRSAAGVESTVYRITPAGRRALA